MATQSESAVRAVSDAGTGDGQLAGCALAGCVAALGRATTLADVAAAIELLVAPGGCRRATLVREVQRAPHRDPALALELEGPAATPADIALAERALAVSEPVQADAGAGIVVASVVTRDAGDRSVLVTEWPAGTAPPAPHDPGWAALLHVLGARVAAALELERLRGSVEHLEQTAQLQSALYAIADLAGSTLDMAEVLRRIHEIVAALMYAENFYIVLYDAGRDALQFLYFADTRDPEQPDLEGEFPADDIAGSLTLALIRAGRPLMGPYARLRRELGLDTDRDYGPESEDWLGVPMLERGVVRGAVVVQSYDAHVRYTDHERALLSYVAQHILTAVARKRAHEDLERRVEERTRELAETNRELSVEVRERQRGEALQQALYRIADLASAELDKPDMLRAIHGVVASLMYAENFFIALYDRERDTLRFIYFADVRHRDAPRPDEEIPAEKLRGGLTFAVIQHGRPLMGPGHEIYRQLGRANTPIGPQSADWLGVPMAVEGDVRGAIVVQSYDEANRYTQDDCTLLGYVAQHILIALQRRQAKAELEAIVAARTHELTVEVRERQRGEQLQAALFRIADLAGSGREIPDMLRAIHEAVGALMYAENFFIALFDPDSQTLRFVYFADVADDAVPDPLDEMPVETMRDSLTYAVIRTGRALMGPSALLQQELGNVDDARYGPDSEDWLGVPMISGGTVRGAVVVQSYDRAVRYTDEDRNLLGYVAQHILTALVRKQAQDELESRVEARTRELGDMNRALLAEVAERQRGEKLQEALFRIADLASSELPMPEMLREIHTVVGGLMYAENFFIVLYDRKRETIRFIYFADTVDFDTPDPNEGIPASRMPNSLTLALLRHGKPLRGPSREIFAALGMVRNDADPTLGPPSEDWLGVPMVSGGEVRGAVVVQSYDRAQRYEEDDAALLGYVAQHILTALQRKQQHAELERRVEERTTELADAVRELRAQMAVRERVELQLKHDTLHDALTGLPNRTYLLDGLGRALGRSRRDSMHRFAVLFLDLDRFKVVNDSVGHLVGDEMLKQASARLAACVREPDMVARLGGDEFAILLENIRGLEDACHVAQRVIRSLGEPMRIVGKELFTSASIGIAISNERYGSAEELLRDADVAMYRAKARGRQRFEIFDERLHQEALRLLDLEGDLRRAILRSEFEPHFQSIVRLDDQSVVGCEALLRWRHPERGLLLPGDFLAVAEESGSAEQIDWQMFEKTCREIPRLTGGGGYVTINVSARHFRAPDLSGQLLNMLSAYGVDPAAVRIEVTEGALLENPEQVRETLFALRQAGVLAALDDFGTGYSSLSYLHRFPLHALKIDRSFVADLESGRAGGSAAVVRAVLALAATLGMEVVAEGIETSDQRACLIELGCRIGQGFLFAHPRPADKVVPAH